MYLYICILIILIIFLCFRDDNAVIHYFVEESRLDPEFRERTTSILSASNWNKKYKIKHENTPRSVVIRLVDRSEMIRRNPPSQYYADGSPIYFSFTRQSLLSRPEIFIDATNWLDGVKESGLSTHDYQTYVINHEFGHALGFDHVECNSSPCPVMWQSTHGCGKFECGIDAGESDFNAKKISGRFIY